MQFFSNTHIDFIGKRRFFYIVSIVVTVAGLVAAFVRGVRFGIDFEGGTEAGYQFSQVVHTEDVRKAMSAFEGAEIKSYGKENQILIRVRNDVTQENREKSTPVDKVGDSTAKMLADKMLNVLEKAFPGNKITVLKVDTIGPKIGSELRTRALWAVLLSIVVMLVYIGFRFEFMYGLGAIIALVHDVLVAFSFAVICNGLFGLNLEMNQGMLAAFLTVVGFSVNDTVIIFDRIREEKQMKRSENLMMLMNRAINETLPRTINTSLTVAMVLVILLLFSGDVLRGFAFTMLVGIITGTYSSIYIASAFVIDSLIRRGKLDPKAERDFSAKLDAARQRAGSVKPTNVNA